MMHLENDKILLKKDLIYIEEIRIKLFILKFRS